ncbi:hypothetical protein HPB47_027092 [Ixodes persulcatus]|uniref:Uncharacterized protein n=1 Tax=Ixodes persulcatus TaxID=34615 RepID=A0AC60PWW8_IXOPE|nr:hypothetical protein HPB47_027092 [Ixodes persulcatus]
METLNVTTANPLISVLSLRDPRTRNWETLENPTYILVILASYLYVSKSLGPRYMKRRDPYELKGAIMIYNLFQVLANMYFLSQIIYHTFYAAGYSPFCQGLSYSTDPHAISLLNVLFWYLWVRVADFLDTIFFVLKKKFTHITVLHVLHHTLVVFGGWMFLQFGGDGQAVFGVCLNSFVHIIMYIYYFLACLGPSVQKYLMVEELTRRYPYLWTAATHGFLIYIAIPQVILILGLFVNFYVQSYIKRRNAGADKMTKTCFVQVHRVQNRNQKHKVVTTAPGRIPNRGSFRGGSDVGGSPEGWTRPSHDPEGCASGKSPEKDEGKPPTREYGFALASGTRPHLATSHGLPELCLDRDAGNTWFPHSPLLKAELLRLRPEDLGYDPSAGPKVASDQPDADADPLLNMLMRLQEAASYSSPQGNDSESADLDHSNGSDRVTPRSDGFEPKAFSRSKKNRHGSVSDVEDIRAFQSDSSAPNSPLLSLNPAHANGLHSNLGDHNMLKLSHSSFALHEREEEGGPEVVQELRKQLREKDLVLTDIRLEALSSAHQLDNLKETLARMRNEMLNLKQDNDRLQRLVSSKSLNSSQTSLPHRSSMDTLENRLSAAELSPTFDVPDVTAAEIPEGKRVTIAVQLGCHGDLEKFLSKSEAPSEVLIGSIYVSGKTKWDHLDSAVRRAFKDHVLKVDPLSNLGLNSESILCYHIDDVVRSKEAELPELLPCGYLVGETLKIQIVLRGTAQNAVDALALQTLIPKSIVQRYVSLLSEHRRIILCGPSGTGKTFLAQKLAEYLVLRSGRDLAAGSIATFSVDHKSAKELRQYLSNVAEQCESSNVSDLPAVIILDNLHHVGSLGEVFNGFLSAKYQKCPFIIGTMNQATCSTTNLQLHHNFRWVLCANHMEPVKGFLGRFLRRRLAEEEISSGLHQPELAKVIDWMPRAWHHLNRFLETHSSSDVTIGPRLFLACPMDVASSQVWFTDLWNYSIVPYLLEAVREGLQLYGKRAPWEDPAEWVLQTYPWPGPASDAPRWAPDCIESADVFKEPACRTCRDSLLKGTAPRFATVSGYKYPPVPEHLPRLNVVEERLVAPRLPFMSLRRLTWSNKGNQGQYGCHITNYPITH